MKVEQFQLVVVMGNVLFVGISGQIMHLYEDIKPLMIQSELIIDNI
jgi:hypothetical protein